MRALRAGAAAVATAAVSVVLAGCGLVGGGPELEAVPVPEPSATPPVADSLRPFYDQQLSWRGCREGLECADLSVPLDYADPGGATLDIAVLRVPATHDDQRLGALVVNPGGPGVSGLEYAARSESIFGAEVRAAYDVVGFDPRGVGESTAIDCLSDDRLDAFLAADPDPDDAAEVAEARALLDELGSGCVQRSGDLARHVSTVEAARDIDVLRAALGEERLTWFGASYGTLLGATYAELFPGRVGRMVLDGAIDPTLGPVETGLVQAEAFETALSSYAADCVADGCFLGDNTEEAVGRIRDLLDDLDARPLPTGDARDLTQGWAVLGIWVTLYNEDFWDSLDEGLRQALDGDGSGLLGLADAYVARGPDGYLDNANEALYAISCLDSSDPLEVAEAEALVDRFERASPTFGRIFAFGLSSCAGWPATTDQRLDRLTAEGAPPIVVIGTSRDPATPLVWAEALADQLDSGVLIRRDGDGHTGYTAGNACVDDAVERYLVSGEVPADPTDC